MISKENVFINDSFEKNVIDSTTHSINQFTTIKYRWSALSMTLTGISLSLIIGVLEFESNRAKVALITTAALLMAVSFVILKRSTRTVNSNNIHSSSD